MDIMETPLGDEIEKVIKEGVDRTFYWSATIHSGDTDHDALKVLNIDTLERYDSKFCPEITITMYILAGKYQYVLMPNINRTEITIHRKPTIQVNYGFDLESTELAHERYTAVIDHMDAPHFESNTAQKLDEFSLNLSDAVLVRARLIPKAMEKFRLRSAGGGYRKIKVEDAIKNILIKHSNALDLPAEFMPKGVDMVPPKDKAEREHILIPHGISATDAPGFVHKHCGGVYSNGFSYFYKRDFWFVWPTYDYTRFNEVEDTLTIINVPSAKFPSLDRTWRMQDKSLIVLSTSEVSVRDATEHNQHTVGNGARFTTANSLKEGTVQVKDNKALYSRAVHNNELIIAQRENELNNVTSASTSITDNKHYVMSSLTLREGSFISMRWDNSSPELIRPGMQARIMYLEKDNVVEKYGVVVTLNTNTQLVGKSVTASQHVSTTDIIMFCERVVFDLA